MDALLQARSDAKGQCDTLVNFLLVELDPANEENSRVLIIGMTNLIWKLDSAFLRRFESRVYVGMANKEVGFLPDCPP